MDVEAWIAKQLQEKPLSVKELKARYDRENFWWVVERARMIAWELGLPVVGKFEDTPYRKSLEFIQALWHMGRNGKVRHKDRCMGFTEKVMAGVDPNDLRPSPELRECYLTDYEAPIKNMLAEVGEMSMANLYGAFGLKQWESAPPNFSACLWGMVDRGEVILRLEYPACENLFSVTYGKDVEERWRPPTDDDSFHVLPNRFFSLPKGGVDGEVS